MRTPGLYLSAIVTVGWLPLTLPLGRACGNTEIWSTVGGLCVRAMICFGAGESIRCRNSQRIANPQSPLLCRRPSGRDG